MFTSLLGAAALYAGVASARPMPDSSMPMSDGSMPPSSMAMPMAMGDSSMAMPASSMAMGDSSMAMPAASSMGSGYSPSSASSADNSYMTSSAMDSSSGGSYGGSYGGSGGYSPPPMSSMAAPPAYSSPSYGSGGSSWGGSGYNDCVNQCVASYGAPSSMAMPTQTGSAMGSYGSGATHTVWVAPTQGVLRYVPFATNASVGDTVKFIWGGNDHTVTKSSILGICNKTSDAPFASGTQNKSFVYTQVVNDTNPTFYYCGTPTHCQQGMFGIINPPNAAGSPSSVASMMPAMAANNSDTSAAWSYTNMVTQNNTGAANWGANMDMSGMADWSQPLMAENVMYTRTFLAANPELLNADGTIAMSNAGSNALMIPQDITAAAKGANNAAGSSSPPANTATSSPSSTPSPAGGAAKPNSAGVMTSSRVAVAFVAVVAAALAL